MFDETDFAIINLALAEGWELTLKKEEDPDTSPLTPFRGNPFRLTIRRGDVTRSEVSHYPGTAIIRALAGASASSSAELPTHYLLTGSMLSELLDGADVAWIGLDRPGRLWWNGKEVGGNPPRLSFRDACSPPEALKTDLMWTAPARLALTTSDDRKLEPVGLAVRLLK